MTNNKEKKKNKKEEENNKVEQNFDIQHKTKRLPGKKKAHKINQVELRELGGKNHTNLSAGVMGGGGAGGGGGGGGLGVGMVDGIGDGDQKLAISVSAVHRHRRFDIAHQRGKRWPAENDSRRNSPATIFRPVAVGLRNE